jgi:RNA polymerase sigma-70 factor (ECF subfamily)
MVQSADRDSEELSQMCLVEILENLHKYRGAGALESWAGQVAYRVTMRHLKTERRRATREAPLPEELGMSGANPEAEASRSAVWERLMTEMAHIPPTRRVSVMLHLAHDYTVEEVAEMTGVSVNTTKDRLRTAYSELRAIFRRNAHLKREILEVIDG